MTDANDNQLPSAGDGGGNTPVALRLNIGAGGTVIDGYTPVDIKTGTDARTLPYADGSVDEVYASHVLEHFPYPEVPKVLKEWARVLKPGGIMRIAVPDIDFICKNRDEFTRQYYDRVIMGGRVDEHDVHGCVFDSDTLRMVMSSVGIGQVQHFEPFANDTSKLDLSLNLEGVKRDWKPVENPRVALVLSQPRLCFTDHSVKLMELARVLKFDIQISSGAFWDRDMTSSTQAAIARFKPDFLLYCDYDTDFNPEDALRLLATINADPTLGAIFAVQMSRHDDSPLVFDWQKDYSTPLTDVDFGHFGLTIIRRQVFEELPQPWFMSFPGLEMSDGATSPMEAQPSWGAWNKSDGDISFWRTFRNHGFRLAQHNQVVAGHMVLCSKLPSLNGKGMMLVPISHIAAAGRPPQAQFDYRKYMPKVEAAATATKMEGGD